MAVIVSRIRQEPFISEPGIYVPEGGYSLELPALEHLESAYGRSKTDPTLYGWMHDGRAGFSVREGFIILDENASEENRATASVKYDTVRTGDVMNLKDLPKDSFNDDGIVIQEGIRNIITPLKEVVSVSAFTYMGGITKNYALVYSFSKDNGNPFFVYVGCLDGEGHDYPKTLRTISPEYSGLLVASSAEELQQSEMVFEEFIQDFVDKLIPSIKSGLTAKVRKS